MNSSSSTSPPYGLQVARRIHGTTGKEHLAPICVGGFLLEMSWQVVAEWKMFKQPAPVVKQAMTRAAIRWPATYIVTAGLLKWAAWRVKQEETVSGLESK